MSTQPTTNHESEGKENYKPLRLQSFIDQYGIAKPRLSIQRRIKNHISKLYHSLSCLYILNAFLERISIIRCLKSYDIRKHLFGDVVSGITVAIMHIPQGMAYGVLTTLPPVYGLYVSFFPVLLYMIFGTCPHLSIGTFAITSLMTAQAIETIPFRDSTISINQSDSPLNVPDTLLIDEKLGIATTLAFLVGLIQIILSFLRLGFLTVYMTEPFISGFTTGAAVHVISSQLPSLFGVRSPQNLPIVFKLPRFYVKLIDSIIKNINVVSTVIGFSSIISLYIAKQINDRYKSTIRIVIPCELILVLICTLISHFIRMHDRYAVSIIGPIQRGLPSPSSPAFSHMTQLIVPSLTIAMVSLCISISIGKLFSRKHNYKINSNQELLAYGISSTVASFFQCFPSAGSMSRSAVQEGNGCKTQLVGGFSCLVLGIVLMALTPLFQSLPMTCLAAIIIVNLRGLLLQIKDFMFYYRLSLVESVLWMITFLTVIFFDVDIGIYVGLCTSFILNTIRTQKPRFAVLGQVGDTEIYKNVKIFPAAQQFIHIRVIRFDESLYACNAPFFKRKFYELIGIRLRHEPLISYKNTSSQNNEDTIYKYVILDCSPFNFIDTVGVKLLIEVYNDLKKRGIQLYLSECRYDIRQMLELMSFYEKTSIGTIYVTTHHAVMAAKAHLNNDIQQMAVIVTKI